MKKSLSLIIFVLVMGISTSLILTGADYVTKDRIAKNAELAWKSAILSHHEIDFTQDNFDEVFDESFDVLLGVDDEGNKVINPQSKEQLILYVNKETNRYSFRFYGNALWDKINGVITLEPDFYTIVAITVNEQGETPGLGGVVAERPYLNTYVGKKFDPQLVVSPNHSDKLNEVDMITGATGTSNAFANVLNSQHRLYLVTFMDVSEDDAWIAQVLDHNNIDHSDVNLYDILLANFNILSEDDLSIYVNKGNGNISFKFSNEGYDGVIKGIVTIEDDWETIVAVSVYEHTEQRGAPLISNPEIMGNFNGKRFDPNITIVNTPSADNEVLNEFFHDDGSGVTLTRLGLERGLNNAYVSHYQTFKDANFNPVDENMGWKIAMLKNHGIEADEFNYEDLFDDFFTLEVNDDLVVYLGSDTRTISFLFVGDGFGGEDSIKGVLTLENDFETIKAVSIYEDNENRGKPILNNPIVMAKFSGMRFSPIVDADDFAVDFTGAVTTKESLENALNTTYQTYYQAFPNLNMDWQLAMLKNNGHDDADETNYKTLFNNNFTVSFLNGLALYTHNTNLTNNILFSADGFTDGPASPEGGVNSIKGVLTLEEDFLTIVAVSVYEHHEKRGAAALEDGLALSQFVSKRFDPSIVIKVDAVEDNEVEDFFYNDPTSPDVGTAVTGTREGLEYALNSFFQRYFTTYFDSNKELKTAILDLYDLDYNNLNYNTVLENNFDITTQNDLTIYTNKDNGNISFGFIADGFTTEYMLPEGGLDSIKGLLTLKNDFKTIVSVNVYEHHERWGAKALNEELALGAFVDKRFEPTIDIKLGANLDNEVEDYFFQNPDTQAGNSVGGTKAGIETALNDTYQIYYNEFKGGN